MYSWVTKQKAGSKITSKRTECVCCVPRESRHSLPFSLSIKFSDSGLKRLLRKENNILEFQCRSLLMWFAIISGSGVFARRTSAKILISWRNSLHRITCRQLRIEFEVRCTCEASGLENNGLHHSTIEISFTMLSFGPDLKSSNILALFVNKRE